MDIWQFQNRLTKMLLSWAVTSVVVGLVLSRREDEFQKGMGEQFAGWGFINALIALFGQAGSVRRRKIPENKTTGVEIKEKEKLARLLWINTGLDVLYVWGGRQAVQTRGSTNERWRGRGWGIIIQGGFLFFFDLINALHIGEVNQDSIDH
jgi:hypothetical protein